MAPGMRPQSGGPARKRRVAFILNSLAGGGAERVMCTLLRASAVERADHDIFLILLDRDPPAYDVPDWVEVVQLDCRHGLLGSFAGVFGALRRLRPDITLSFLTRANVANVAAASLLRLPAIVSERVNTSSHLRHGPGAAVARKLVRWFYPLADAVIAVSPGVAEDLQRNFGVPGEKISVISNPIDGDELRARAGDAGPAEDGPAVAAMGRLVPNKNFRVLIDAFARAGLAGNLLILGEGPERAALQRQAEALGLDGRVVMPGFSANPFPALSRAGVFVLPSNAEGFPNALLEAMSVGAPVISTNCPSGPAEVLAGVPREAVGEELCLAEYGILVAPDNADAMADALRAMQDPARRAQYKERAVRRAADYSVARAKDAYWQVIRARLAAAARGPG